MYHNRGSPNAEPEVNSPNASDGQQTCSEHSLDLYRLNSIGVSNASGTDSYHEMNKNQVSPKKNSSAIGLVVPQVAVVIWGIS